MKVNLSKNFLLLLVLAISIHLQAQTQSPRKALSFNGVNQNVSGTSGISTSLTAITIEAWVYNNTLPSGKVQRYVTINPEVAVLRYDGTANGGTNELHFYIKNSSGAFVSLRADNVLSTGTWMHIAGTFDGTTMKLYLNGYLLKSGSATGLYKPSGSFLFSQSSSEAFNGKMDEVSVWNYARTVSDIREDMYRAAPISDARLINYWQFNNGSGTTLTDLKGTAKGTLNNMTNSNWIASTIPFAAGAVNSKVVIYSQIEQVFDGTGVRIKLSNAFDDEFLVVSRIDTLPNISLTKSDISSQYWVIKRFNNRANSFNLTFNVNRDITNEQQANPNLIKLYQRSSNSDGQWSFVATASSADAANDNVFFNGITSLDGQYLIYYSPQRTPGTALNFDGSDAWVTCGNASNLNITGSITLEAWINPSAWYNYTKNDNYSIISKRDNMDYTNAQGYSLNCKKGGRLCFYMGYGNGSVELTSASLIQLGKWTHVAAVYDGSNMYLYVNGVLAGKQAQSSSIGTSSQSLLIGTIPYSINDDWHQNFAGKIDEVSVWNVARSASQIWTDMHNVLAGETGMVGYWQFNDGSGTTLTDGISSNNGTLTNMKTGTCWVESYAVVVPTIKDASNITSSGFTANWSAPALGTIDNYNLYVATDSTFTTMLSGYNPLVTTNTSQTLTGLSSYQTYYYRVTASKSSVSGQGAYSGFKKATPIIIDAAPSGSGTSSSPYQLSTLANLQWMKNTPASWNKYFILINDIDASNTRFWDNGNGFTPIGNSTVNFTGIFNGQVYSIDGITINRPTTDNVGFFGFAAGDSIKNLSLTNVNIKGQNNVGGLIGQSSLNKISKCSTTGSVRATGNNAGGLIGNNAGKVDNCFSRASVAADQNYAGGLFGIHGNGLVIYCYASGSVVSTLNKAGGFVGAMTLSGGTVTGSYWDTGTSGQALGYFSNAGSFGAKGKTTELMMQKSTYTSLYFAQETDDASNENWYMMSSVNNGYPAFFFPSSATTKAATNITSNTVTLNWNVTKLGKPASTYHGVCWDTISTPTLANNRNEFASPTVASFSVNLTNLTRNTTYYYRAYTRSTVDTLYSNIISFTTPNGIMPAGDGSAANPYQIANIRNLEYLSTTPGLWNQGYTFIQTANINAAETRNWDGGQGFIPIGNQNVYFQGNYHGKGNSIDSLYINRPGSSQVAFFGYIDETPSGVKSTIDSLSLTNVNITGKSHVGGLGGDAIGFNISHCSVIGGSVTATNSGYSSGVGGMFGSTSGYTADNNSTSHCFAAVTVSGQGEVGGFVGQTYGGYINQCYSAGPVSGTGEYVGGFVGYRMSLGNIYTLDSSYYDIQASGQATGAGRNDQPAYNHLQGKTTAEMKTQATYDGWDFNKVWSISGSLNNGYPYFDYPNTQISTSAVSNIANNTATGNGSIIHKGSLAITAHGFCWNTTGAPTIANSKVNLGTATTDGDFTGSITGLRHNTSYYVRAYLIDAKDTVYGAVVNFTTTNSPAGGTCLKTNNQSDYEHIAIRDNNSLDLTNNYSIEVWINVVGSSSPANRPIISKGTSGYYLARTKTGNCTGLIFDDMVTADNILTTNKWYHVAAVNDNGTRHLYLNGIEQQLTGTPRTVTANTDSLYMFNVNDRLYLGKFEEMSLWNIALSESQIRENMHLPLTGSETGLVSNWQFDEGSGVTVHDKMGTNNGTFYNRNVVMNNANGYWVSSTIPFGSGFSNTQTVSATGTTNFTNTGLSINFTSKSSNADNFVVTRIDTFPNIEPAGLDAVFSSQYWAVHLYGNGGYKANLTFTLNENLTADDEHQPGNIVLYTRTSNTDESWTKLASGASVNAANNQVTFNGLTDIVNADENDPNKIYYLGQYLIAREQCLVYIPDANFKTALLAAPGLDANKDGKIQCSEASAYTGNLKLANQNIADFTGLEAFTNATELACGANQVSSLDLTSNKALVKLNCSSSSSLTSLNVTGLKSLNSIDMREGKVTTLDLSTNTALTTLDCRNHALTSLNVTGLKSLTAISCANNQLTTLDVSSNIALTNLSCGSNSLTILNVKNGNNINLPNFGATGNPNLGCIQVDNASWSTTNWTNKDATASYSSDCGYIKYSITASVNPANSGSTKGAGNYYAGESVSVTATETDGYTFKNWTESGTEVSTSATYSFTASANRTLIANFTQDSYSISASVSPANSGIIGATTLKKGGNKDFIKLLSTYGANISLKAFPAPGYTFGNWTNNGIEVSDAVTFLFSVLGDINLVANFIPISYTIAASASLENSGTITGAGHYNYGSTVSLTATSKPGYTFNYWTENGIPVSPTATYTFIAGANRTLVANYTQNTYLISASAILPTSGTITGMGSYKYGANVSLTAIPKTGYIFTNWTESGTQVSINSNYSFTVAGNRTLLANFTASFSSYTITAVASPSNSGTVTGSGNYNTGANVSLTATPNNGYKFTNWTENGTSVSTSATYSFIAGANKTLVANFALNSYLISASASNENTGSVTGSGNYNYGDNVSLTALAKTGYTFTNWTENGKEVSPDLNYSFTATANKILVANFTLNSYLISASSNPENIGNFTGGGSYNYGDNVSISTAVTGYTFIKWTENGKEVSIDINYSFTASKDRILVANFTRNSYQISASVNAENLGTITGEGSYNYGENIQLTASPTTGYIFINWTENGTEVSTNATYSFTAQENRTLIANFVSNSDVISASVSPENSGSVSGTGTFNFGENVSLTASVETGYTFVNWTENGTEVSTSATYSFTANTDRTLVANFTPISYLISGDVNDANSGIITGDGIYNEGENVALSAIAGIGYKFTDWTEDDTQVSTDSIYSFTAKGNRNLVANFTISTGLESVFENNSIIIFPNPNNGKFTIALDNNYNGEVNIKIHSVLGSQSKIIKINKTTNKMTYDVDMDNKAKGIYLIDFQTTKYKVVKTIIIN